MGLSLKKSKVSFCTCHDGNQPFVIRPDHDIKIGVDL